MPAPREIAAALILVAGLPAGRAAGQAQLELDRPGTQFLEALPVGNGRLGAMVFGRVVDDRLPINEIKVDRSFVARMAEDDTDRAITRSVLALGRGLGLTTVAEGVEDRGGWDILRAFGCDQAQGFLVSRPLAADRFREWMTRQPESARPKVTRPGFLSAMPGAAANSAGSAAAAETTASAKPTTTTSASTVPPPAVGGATAAASAPAVIANSTSASRG